MHYENIYRNQIAIKDDILQIKGAMKSYQNYRNDNVFWLEVILNYIIVIFAFFWFTICFPPTLALTNFQRKIFNLAKVYRWQR